jgi:hypothetical protein
MLRATRRKGMARRAKSRRSRRKTPMKMFSVKSLGGENFVRADRVLALQTNVTGQTVLVMEGGVTVQSSEKPGAIAARLDELLAAK